MQAHKEPTRQRKEEVYPKTSRKGLIILALAALCVQAAQAIDVTVDETGAKSTPVTYSDLNLTSNAGAISFQHRLKAAAEKVCPDVNSVRDLHQKKLNKQCTQDAIFKACQKDLQTQGACLRYDQLLSRRNEQLQASPASVTLRPIAHNAQR